MVAMTSKMTSKTKLVLFSLAALLAVVVIAVAVWGASSGQAGNPPQSTPAPLGDPSAELAKLATLPVKGRAPKTGYARSLFGVHGPTMSRCFTGITAVTPATTCCVLILSVSE